MPKVKSRLSILEASPADVPKLAPLFDAYRQFYGRPSDVGGAGKYLHERLSARESKVFAAVKDSVFLGFVQLYPSFSSVSMKRLWILNDLFVVPDARRGGVAKALMERARKLAADTGAEGLVLETANDNLKAQALYEKLGWKRETQFYRYNLDL